MSFVFSIPNFPRPHTNKRGNLHRTKTHKILQMSVSEGEIGSSETSTTTSEAEKSAVSFSTVEFRDYPIILGDNPSTSCGPSIEIDWESHHSVTIDLEEYETNRYPRRSKKELQMPIELRTHLLHESGYTMRQILVQTKARKNSKTMSREKFLPKVTRIISSRRRSC